MTGLLICAALVCIIWIACLIYPQPKQKSHYDLGIGDTISLADRIRTAFVLTGLALIAVALWLAYAAGARA